MAGCSAANAAATVTGRPVITRPSSIMSPSAISWFSAASDATTGTGTRWRRRNRPISPSTPPFSCAPSRPGTQKNEAGPVVAAQRDEPLGLGPVAAAQHPHHGGLEVVIPDPAGQRAEVPGRQHVPFQERFLRLGRERDVERTTRA